jgi:hypothetical protein
MPAADVPNDGFVGAPATRPPFWAYSAPNHGVAASVSAKPRLRAPTRSPTQPTRNRVHPTPEPKLAHARPPNVPFCSMRGYSLRNPLNGRYREELISGSED